MTERVYHTSFFSDDLDQSKKFVSISEFSGKKKISERKLSVLDVTEIYRSIDEGKQLNFENCYIKDFSLDQYRSLRGLEKGKKIDIQGIQATNAFFDCDAEINFSYAQIQGVVSFKGSIFTHGTLSFNYSDITSDTVDFSECRFHSHQTNFEHADFKAGRINFEHAMFHCETVSFVNGTFHAKETNFRRVNFGKSRVRFQFAEFSDGNKIFERIRVMGSVFDFRRVLFNSGKVDFRRSLFSDSYVTFEEIHVTSGKFTFRNAHVEGEDMTFRRAEFGTADVSFDQTDFSNRSITFEGCKADVISISDAFVRGTLDLRIKRVQFLDLSQTYLYGITDLNFEERKSLEKLSFRGVRNLGKIIIDWRENSVQKLIERAGGTEEQLAEQFNILKANFSDNGQYTDEDSAYVCFKRYEHRVMKKRYLQKSAGWKKPFVHFAFFCRLLIFDKAGVYATSPARVLGSMMITISFFAALYVILHYTGAGEIVNAVNASDKLNIVDKSFYHSAITFFTIGYGDYYPISFSRLVSAIEGWTGVFMMSYFTVAFVRKILR